VRDPRFKLSNRTLGRGLRCDFFSLKLYHDIFYTYKLRKYPLMSCGHGFGKIILFGDHFVVFGLPGIVTAIDRTIDVTVKKTEGKFRIIDKTKKFPGVPELTWEVCKEPITRIIDRLGITAPLEITIHGNLPIPHSGIGSSAASLVAFVRAVNREFGLQMSEEQINELAYEGEKEVHGTPSGIDNAAATYGKTFLFKKGASGPELKELELKEPLHFVLIESGVQTNAKKVIGAVKNFVEKNREIAKKIFDEYGQIFERAQKAVSIHDLKTVGALMNKNHELLQKLTVSSPEQDEIVRIARNSGAIGAKVTGAGRGGLCVALAPSSEVQDRILVALQSAGYAAIKAESNCTVAATRS